MHFIYKVHRYEASIAICASHLRGGCGIDHALFMKSFILLRLTALSLLHPSTRTAGAAEALAECGLHRSLAFLLHQQGPWWPLRQAEPVSATQHPHRWFFLHRARHGHDVDDYPDYLSRVPTFDKRKERVLRNVYFLVKESARTWFETTSAPWQAGRCFAFSCFRPTPSTRSVRRWNVLISSGRVRAWSCVVRHSALI